MFKIPLTNAPNQSFTSTIYVNGKNITLKFFIRYLQNQSYWAMDIKDSKGNVLVAGIPLIVNYDLLAQYQYLGIGSAKIISISGKTDMPDNTNLGNDYILLWGDNLA